MHNSTTSEIIVIITEGANTIIYSKKQGKINWLSSLSVILFTTLDVMFRDLPLCMKCFEYPSLNIKFRAALSIILFDFKPGAGPFNLMNANLSTVPVSCTFSTSTTFLFFLKIINCGIPDFYNCFRCWKGNNKGQKSVEDWAIFFVLLKNKLFHKIFIEFLKGVIHSILLSWSTYMSP